MIIVHHLNNSRSQRVLWLLEELEIPYDIRFYQRDPKTMLAPPELRAVHPLGKSPVITDGEIVVAETGAIIEYILNQYGQGRLRPAPGTEEARRFTYWLHYAEGSLMSPLLLALVFNRVAKEPVPFFVKPIVAEISKKVMQAFVQPQLNTHRDFIEGELARSTWFAGDTLTAADIQMSFPLEAFATRGKSTDKAPRITQFLERIHARPAYQRALQAGGPYSLVE